MFPIHQNPVIWNIYLEAVSESYTVNKSVFQNRASTNYTANCMVKIAENFMSR